MVRSPNEKILPALIFLFGSSSFAADAILEVITLKHRPADELSAVIAPLLEDSERATNNDNSLILKTTTERLPVIRDLVRKLDIAASNLIITVIQSRHDTAEELNAAAAAEKTIPSEPPDHIRWKMRGLNVGSGRLKEQDDSQIIRTLEGKTAYIKTGEVRSASQISLYDSGYGYPVVTGNSRLIEANSGFAVTPRLADEQVILEVSPWSDAMDRRGDMETHSAQTILRTRLGVWVEIGSFAHGSQERQQEGFLKHHHSTVQKTLHLLVKVDKAD